ncbi:MOSC domain-containing protein [soil metagenome]
MKKVGEIAEIWRYPVKGMAGERLQSANLSAHGLQGDRIWAVRDNARQELQSCKFRPELLLCSARLSAASSSDVDIVFPDGTRLGATDAAAHVRVSQLIGHASTLEALRPDSDMAFYRRYKTDDHTWLTELKATFDREGDEPLPGLFDEVPASAAEFVVLPGTFFLVTPFHLLTTATLAWLKGLNPQSDWDARRFRPNVVIDTGGAGQGPVEQDWIRSRVVLGDATVTAEGTTPRCGAITRAQAELPADKSVLRTVVKRADQNVGIYGGTMIGGELKVGDAVYVDEPA